MKGQTSASGASPNTGRRSSAPSNSRRISDRLLGMFAAVMSTGCVALTDAPDLGEIYTRSAREGHERRNPIIVIPGILGSKLAVAATGRVIWGAFGGDYANPATAEGARLLSLPMEEGKSLADLTDEVEAAGALDRVRVTLLGLPIEQGAYVHILRALGVGGYRDQDLGESGAIDYGPGHFTCFQFDYDWRRDLSESAGKLHDFILDRREYVREQRKIHYGEEDPDVKFDIVAHSMGGLLTRYYLRYGPQELRDDGELPDLRWQGAEYVERAILVATPNAGAIESLAQLVRGADFVPLFPHYSAVILGTMPAVYQLLPRPRHAALLDAADPARPIAGFTRSDFWARMGWGLLDPGEEAVLEMLLPDVADPELRRRISLDHVDKCLRRAVRFHAAIDVPARRPDGLDLILVAGDAIPTNAAASVDLARGRLKMVEKLPGDGTVTRASALMDERMGAEWSPRLKTPIDWSHVMFIFNNHLGLTQDAAFTDNVLYHLLEEPRRGKVAE